MFYPLFYPILPLFTLLYIRGRGRSGATHPNEITQTGMQYYAIAISISIRLQRRGRRNLGIEQEVNAIEQSGLATGKKIKVRQTEQM